MNYEIDFQNQEKKKRGERKETRRGLVQFIEVSKQRREISRLRPKEACARYDRGFAVEWAAYLIQIFAKF